MATATIAQIAKAVDRGVKEHYVDAYETTDPQVERILNVMTAEDYNQEHQRYTGITQYPVVPEGGTYTEQRPIQSYGTNFIQVKYGVIIPHTIELEKWSKKKAKEITNSGKMHAKAQTRTIEQKAASIFNNGFNTSFTKYGDAKPLFSTDHTSAGGFTAQSNASATGLVFSESAVETAQIAGESQLDDQNQVINVLMNTIIVPPALQKLALEIADSDLRSGTADNDKNIHNPKNRTLKSYKGRVVDNVHVWQYLRSGQGGSNTAWFMADSEQHRLLWLWGVKPRVDTSSEAGFENDTIKVKGSFQADYGWDDWRCVWGSKGDGAAYSS